MRFIEFLKNLLLRMPQELLIALLRLLLLVLLFIFILLLKFLEWLRWLFRTKNLLEEETEGNCGDIPEDLVRRPDPAIYSQQYLRSQGLSVTWNNPDIWMAPASDPAAIEPDSYHLQADTDYIVSVRAHNASVDAAIGVKVRLLYRPWSFNSPDLLPVQTDSSGDEVFRFVDIPPMGSAIATFLWHTPALGPGEQKHYCIQAHLSHPLDINPANNVGQENTNVYSQNPGSVTPGEVATIEIPLFNTGRQALDFRFHLDRYAIGKDKYQLKLKTARGKAKISLGARLGHLIPTVSPQTKTVRKRGADDEKQQQRVTRQTLFGKVEFGTPKSKYRSAKGKYVGFESLRKKILEGDYTLPENMEVNVDQEQIRLEPTESHLMKFEIKVPDDAPAGSTLPVNIIAETATGEMKGGVTILFNVK